MINPGELVVAVDHDGKTTTMPYVRLDVVLAIINKYKSYHNGAHWTVLKEIKEEIKSLKGEQG